MAIISISEAAKRVGVARSTIYKRIQGGTLQATIKPDGTKGIDTDELTRVFGESQAGETPESEKVEETRAGQEVHLLQQQVSLLQQQLASCQQREQRLLALLEREQQMLPGPIQSVVDGITGVFCGIRDSITGKQEPAQSPDEKRQA